MDYYSQIERAYNELVSEGVIFPVQITGHEAEQVDDMKGILTRRAAYYINLQNNPAYGLLEKTSGANSYGYSTDLIMVLNGDYYDTCRDQVEGNMVSVVPMNSGAQHDEELIPRWRMPTKELAGLEGPIPHPPPPNGSTIPYDESKAVDFGLGINQVNEEYKAIHGTNIPYDPGMISVMSTRAAWDYYVGGLDWETSKNKHLNEYRTEYGLPLAP